MSKNNSIEGILRIKDGYEGIEEMIVLTGRQIPALKDSIDQSPVDEVIDLTSNYGEPIYDKTTGQITDYEHHAFLMQFNEKHIRITIEEI